MNLVGIVGRRRAGKDTLCQAMIKAALDADLYALRFAFGDEVKREVAAALRVDESTLEAQKETYRPLIQAWGACRRRQNPAYWIEKVDEWISCCPSEISIISDVRYTNEAEWIRSQGGVLIKVIRPTRALDPAVDTHESESDQDGMVCDHEVEAQCGEVSKLLEFASTFITTHYARKNIPEGHSPRVQEAAA